MKTVLGKKQTSSHENWLHVYSNIEQYVSKQETDNLVDRLVEQVKPIVCGKRVAYAWSGGKDSIALGFIMEQAGVHECLLGRNNLEYPAFLRWIDMHKPEGLEIINTGQDLKWLASHQEMIFPNESSLAAKWFSIVQHRAQDIYVKKHKVDILCLGRRIQDGNYVGSGGIYTNARGITRFSPIAETKHEEILAIIHYYHLHIPPIYTWSRGFRVGTHCWPARQWCGCVENGFREVYEIDSSLVEEAANYIPSAKAFLRRNV
jgi:hypothetical protein